ncbi:LysR family transcriptional regulator [Novosphingobium beihaiensis]|uniref:LysR family transcriptional regulator n=1 Tax=Novosphingobium beihaiensis TaxID=2930389 RepID=A0ABT0BRG8_9SPHN|nr:LysR family transcriptional regulator [Novosphingobium beihaiensis]MCJ2187670.1 LysR family transcriptional regulator [Novosphingobium beihaiensis]
MNAQSPPFAGVLEYVETVRSGSFTAAGARLGLTGSAIGKSVTRLEERLGVKLLHRTTRKLTPTPEGERFFEGWVALLDDVQGLEQDVAVDRGAVVGRMRIHLPAAFGRRHVMPVLTRLACEYPALDLSVSFTERRINLIDEGVDLVVRIGTLEDDADLVARRLGRQRLVICASPSYLEAHGSPATPAELTGHACIAGSQRNGQVAWLLRDAGGRTFRQTIRARHEFSDGDAMVDAVAAGCGLSQLPTWLVQDQLDAGTLVRVLPAFEGAEMPIHAVWPRSRFLLPKQRAVIDALVADASASGSAYRM